MISWDHLLQISEGQYKRPEPIIAALSQHRVFHAWLTEINIRDDDGKEAGERDARRRPSRGSGDWLFVRRSGTTKVRR